jgi:hypothetical protein
LTWINEAPAAAAEDLGGRLRRMEETMIRMVALAFTLAFASAAQAMPVPPPLQVPESLVTQVRQACGVGFQRRAGVCVRNTTVRRTRRAVRRCRIWNGGVCVRWYP